MDLQTSRVGHLSLDNQRLTASQDCDSQPEDLGELGEKSDYHMEMVYQLSMVTHRVAVYRLSMVIQKIAVGQDVVGRQPKHMSEPRVRSYPQYTGVPIIRR
jgi:hypothetical protein